MFGMGFWELIVIAIVALLVLGPEKLPEAAKTLSKGIRDFRKQTRELQQTIEADEEIGGAIRDIKSALRGDEVGVRTPSVRAKPHSGSPEQVDATAVASAAGIGAGVGATEGDTGAEDLRATRDMRRPGQDSTGDSASAAAEPETADTAAAASATSDATATAELADAGDPSPAGATSPDPGIVLRAASGTVARSDASASTRTVASGNPADPAPSAGETSPPASCPDEPDSAGAPPATDRDNA